jgi:4-hydroxy-3-methylbut-2-en-1-yl diphosphate synthase IspG/GcpE
MSERIEKSAGQMVDSIETVLRDKYGNIKSRKTIKNGKIIIETPEKAEIQDLDSNSFTNTGMAAVAQLIEAAGGSYFKYIAIGINTGSTAEGATNTAMDTQKSRLLATTIERFQTTVANDTCRWIVLFSKAVDATLTGTMSIVEVGVFDTAVTGGILLLRKVYTPADVCNWDQSDTLTVTVTFRCMQGA